MENKYILRKVSIFSLFKLGFVIGLILNLLPTFLIILVSFQLIVAINAIMQHMILQVGAGPIGLQVNLIDQLNLQSFFLFIQTAASFGILQFILIVLALLILSSLVSGLWLMLTGLFFNLLSGMIGGIELTLSTPLMAGGGSPLSYSAPSNLPQPSPQVSPQVVNAPNSGPRLEITQPYLQAFPLTFPVCVVGSNQSCNISLPGLPDKLFQIVKEGDQLILQMLSQVQTPVRVQGHAVQAKNLIKDGFVIQYGPYNIIYRAT
jgi:hypothetical protein